MRRSLLIIIFARTTLNMAFRIVYPFLPAIARGLGISVAVAGQLVALRGIAGLIAPVAGPLADRYGRRRVMEAGLLAFAVGSVVLGVAHQLWLAVLAFILIGISKSLYDPAMQAYLGDRIPYEERGRAMGLTELAWSASWLLGVPASGLLMERLGWRAPWLALMLLGLAGWLLTAWGLPRARVARAVVATEAPVATRVAGTLRRWGWILAHRHVASAMLVGIAVMTASDTVLIVYGAFLESTFGLSLAALGLASIVVGLAEAVAEFGSAGLVDRIGKRRSVAIGLVLLGLSFILLPRLTGSLVSTLAGITLMIASFEFALVSFLPLVSELVPEQRADVLSINVAVLSLAHMLGAALGGWLWQFRSIDVNTGVATVLVIVALTALSLTREGTPAVQEGQPQPLVRKGKFSGDSVE